MAVLALEQRGYRRFELAIIALLGILAAGFVYVFFAAGNQDYAGLSVALLVGLGANALLGLWWADPLAALVISTVALREGRQSWSGDACGCTPARPDSATCQDDCCTSTDDPQAHG